MVYVSFCSEASIESPNGFVRGLLALNEVSPAFSKAAAVGEYVCANGELKAKKEGVLYLNQHVSSGQST